MGLPKPKRESGIRARLKGTAPIPEELRDLVYGKGGAPEAMDPEERAGIVERLKREADADGSVRNREKAMVALAEVVAVAEGFRQAVAEGRLSCEDLPYVARKKLSEIFRGLDGRGFGDAAVEAELKSQLAAQQEEIRKLRAAASKEDPETAALEREVEAMLAAGAPPESYGDRADRKEKPPEFLKRVYGKYLEKGREAIFLFQLRKLDPKFGKSLDTYCWKEGIPAESLIPTKRLMADRTLVAVGDADEVRRAVNAVSRRRQLAAKKAAEG